MTHSDGKVERPDFSAMQFRHDEPWLVRLFDPCRTFTPDVWAWVGTALGVWAVLLASTALTARSGSRVTISLGLSCLVMPLGVFCFRGLDGRRKQWCHMRWNDPMIYPICFAYLAIAGASLVCMGLPDHISWIIYGFTGLPYILMKSRRLSPRARLDDFDQIDRWLEYQKMNPLRKLTP